MGYHYSNPERESDKYALPDVECFYAPHGNMVDDDGNELPAGWYYWFCFPGCMPDSEPSGPYKTEEEALEDCRCCHAW